MSGFFDVQCRCGRRFGWCGEWSDRPACPHCGFRPPQDELDAIQMKLDAARERALADDRDGLQNPWRQMRRARSMTLHAAAVALKISCTELSSIERGEAEPVVELIRCLRALYSPLARGCP